MIERRSVGSRIISALLVVCMLVGMLPATTLSVFAADSTTTTNVGTVMTYAQNLLNSNFSKAADATPEKNDANQEFSWDTEGGKGDTWRYYNGLMVDAFLMAGTNSDSGNALKFADSYYNANVTSSGYINRYGDKDIDSQELDSIQPARALFDLLGTVVDKDKYESVLHTMYTELMSFPTVDGTDGNFRHKDNWTDHEIGLDGLYMAQPFLMEYANAIDQGLLSNKNGVSTSAIYEGVYKRMMWVINNMSFTDASGNVLLNHGYDGEGTNNVSSTIKGNGVVWGRGVGWFLAGLVDVIEMMPAGTYKNELIAELPDLFDGMIAYQHTSGMWYNVVYGTNGTDVTSGSSVSGNKLETSGTALMAYAMLKAANNNWVGSTYKTKGLAAFNGIFSQGFATSSNVTNIYMSAGVGMYSEIASEYCDSKEYEDSDNEAKGVGPLIMAAVEANKANGASESFGIGVVVAPEMTVAEGTTELTDTTGIKATLVSNRGTIDNGKASSLTYSVGTASNGKATVTVKNGDYTIDTFEVNVADPDTPATGTGTLKIETGAATVPSTPTFTTGNWVEIKAPVTSPTSGAKTYTQVTSINTTDQYVIVAVPDGNSPENGSVLTENSKALAGTSVTISDRTLVTTSDLTNCIVKFGSTSGGDITFQNSGNVLKKGGTGSSTGKSSTLTAGTGDYADAFTFTAIESNGVLRYGDSGWECVKNGETQYLYIYKVGTASSGTTTTVPGEYAQLVGTKGYVYPFDTKSDPIIAAIKADTSENAFKIMVSESADGKNAKALDDGFDNSRVSVYKNPEGTPTFSATTANTYYFGVSVDGKQIGTIPVTIYDDSSTTASYAVSLSVTPGAIVANVGDGKTQLNPTVTVDGLNGYGYYVTYSTGNSSVATVSDSGQVTIVGAGSTTITATVSTITYNSNTYDSDDFGTITASVPVVVSGEIAEETVTYEVTGIVLTPATIAVGETAQAVGYAKASDGSDHSYTFVYTSSNGNVATHDYYTGVMTAVGEGEAYITAYLDKVDGVEYRVDGNMLTVSTLLTVTAAEVVYTLEMNPTSGSVVELEVGETLVISALVKASDGSSTDGWTYTWSNYNSYAVELTTDNNTATVKALNVSDQAQIPVSAYYGDKYLNGTITIKVVEASGDTPEPVYTYDVKDSSGKALAGQIVTLNKGESFTVDPYVLADSDDVSNRYSVSLQATSNATAVTIEGTKITANEVGTDTAVTIKATITFLAKSASGGTATFTVNVKAASTGTDNESLWVHNFTDDGFDSNGFYTIAGSNAEGKHGTYTYNGEALNAGLKFDSKGSVVFTAPYDGAVTIVVGSQSSGHSVVIKDSDNGTVGTASITSANTMVTLTVDVEAGETYTVKQGSGETALYYIAYAKTGDASAPTCTYQLFAPNGTQITNYTSFSIGVGDVWQPTVKVLANGIDVSEQYTVSMSVDNAAPVKITEDRARGIARGSANVTVAVMSGETTAYTFSGLVGLNVTAEEHEIDCSAGFTAEYQDKTLTENIQTWTFDVESLASLDGQYFSWNNALVQIMTGSTYDGTIRADNFAWTGVSVDNRLAPESATGIPSDWNAWVEACKAGAEGKVTAQLANGSAVVAIEVNGLQSTYIMPLADGDTHTLRLTGEFAYLDNVTASTEHIDISDVVEALQPSGSVYIHNFTEHGTSSEFYSFSNSNTATDKGTVTYNGETLTKCLKMESKTEVSFTTDKEGTLTLVFGGATDPKGKSVYINGVSYTVGDDGTVVADLKADTTYKITKDDAIFLYYMAYAEEGSTGGSGGTGGSGSTDTNTVTYELFTGTGADIEDGDIFLIVNADKTIALMNTSDGKSDQAAALSASIIINGNYAVISDTNEPYATWTVSSWSQNAKEGLNYYSMKFGNGKHYIGDSSTKILKNGGSTIRLFPTGTPGMYALASNYEVSDGVLVPNGKYWYYDSEDKVWLASETAGYVYLYKQVVVENNVTVAAPGTLYIGASGNNGSMPSTDLTETVLHNGSQVTSGYTAEWSITSGSDVISINSSTGAVTAKKGGVATVHLKVTLSDGTVYQTDVNVTVQNPSIVTDDEMALIHGYAAQETGTITATVAAGGSRTNDYELRVESSNENVATAAIVDGKVVVTAKGEGTATITTYITEVNGLDVSGLLVGDTTTVKVTERAVSLANLNSYDFVVQKDATEEELHEALHHMVLTMEWNTGETLSAIYEEDDNLVITVDPSITATPGIHTAVVTYKDANGNEIFRDTIWIHVENFDLSKFDGVVMTEHNVVYTLDTDGVNVNEEYVIVANGYAIALKNPSASEDDCTPADTAAVEFQNDGNNLTIGKDDATLSAWLMDTKVGENQYNASNFLRYLGIDDAMMLVHHNVEHVYINHVGSGVYEIILSYNNGQPEYYLNYNGTAWEATTAYSTVKLYHKEVSYQDYGINFNIAPSTQQMPVGASSSVTSTLRYNDTVNLTSDRYEVIWTSSDPSIATVDEEGNINAISEGTVTITARLVAVDGFEVICNTHEVPYIEKTATVEVVSAETQTVLEPNLLIIGVGNMPNLNKVNLVLKYPELSAAEQEKYNTVIQHENLNFNLADAKGTAIIDGVSTEVTGFSTAYPGEYTVDVTYNGMTFKLTIRVVEDPYAGLDPADSIPGYPDAGAVRIGKSATGVKDFTRTGVVKVELDAAGISTRSAVDVVLIVDVSNSMAWSMDWFDGMDDDEVADANDQDKIPAVNDDNTINGETKLDMAMASAKEFASILLGTDAGNTLSFVTFAGNDTDHGGSSDNLDSVRTPFLGVTDYASAEAVFNATEFTHLVKNSNGSKVDYYLNIGGHSSGDSAVTSGYKVTTEENDDGETVTKYSGKSNRGNTNYDYAFGEALDAVADLKQQWSDANGGKDYDTESGRQLHVVFMTDGAPSAYNGKYLSGRENDTTWKDKKKYTKSGYSESEWLTYIKNYHELATELKDKVYGAYTVGFDIEHGGFGEYSWSTTDMERVLNGLVRNTIVPVTMATDEEQLNTFYTNLAKALAYAGTNAMVTDQIGENFSLFTGAHMYGSSILNGDNVANDKLMSSELYAEMQSESFSIDVLSYRLVLASDLGSTMDVIGTDGKVIENVTITNAHLGLRVNEDPDVIESITFEFANGELSAYSDALGSDNILSTNVTMEALVPEDDGTTPSYVYDTVIEGKYFTYTRRNVTVDGETVSEENIRWKIGDITDREVAISYYAYLEGSLDNPKEAVDGLYATNEFAYLEYVDVNGDYVKRDFGIPQAAWGKAGITYRFYLVNDNGEFVNYADVVFDNPANRILLNQTAAYMTELNNFGSFSMSAAQALKDAGLSGYELYDPELITKVISDISTRNGGVTITDSSKPGISDLVFVNDVMKDGTYVNTIIDIPVILRDLGESDRPLANKTVVMDYGKPIQINPFNATEAQYAGGYSDVRDGTTYFYRMEIIGFAEYDADHDMWDYVSNKNVKTSLTTANGTYTLGAKDSDGLVHDIVFTPSRFLEEVDQVFVAIKFAEYYSEGGLTTNNDKIMYKQLNVLPATVMYYEAEMFPYTEKDGEYVSGEFTYTGSWSTHGTASGVKQDSYENNKIYGYDAGYTQYPEWSDGAYRYVEGTGVNNTTVGFTFTGTGFDIISRTDKVQGDIRVTYTNVDTGVSQKVVVINKGVNGLYQIPVVSVKDLDFGTYNVTIGVYEAVSYSEILGSAFEHLDRGNQFCFDALRIYGPSAGTEEFREYSGSKAEGKKGTYVDYSVNNWYAMDGEYDPTIKEIGKELIAVDDFNASDDGNVSGILYLDDKGNLVESGDTDTGVEVPMFNEAGYPVLDEKGNVQTQKLSAVATYDKIGPNHEVYLQSGKGIVFKLTVDDPSQLASIDIAVKSITGNSATLEAYIRGTTGTTDNQNSCNVTVNSATALYYDLMSTGGKTFSQIFTADNGKYSAYVIIKNSGSDILSLTDLKIAWVGSTEGKSGVASISVDTMSARIGAAYVLKNYQTVVALTKGADGVWYYTENGVINTDYVGLGENRYGVWYVNNGTIDFTYTGLLEVNGETYYIHKGAVNTAANGLEKVDGQWLYFVDGKVDSQFVGLVANRYGTWYVANGAIDFTQTGLVEVEGGLAFVRNGLLSETYVGLAKSSDGRWLYVENGIVDFTYTGIAKNSSGWWYISDSAIDFTYTGTVETESGTYNVRKGLVDITNPVS